MHLFSISVSSWLDGRHVVFGTVLSGDNWGYDGLKTVKKVEAMGSQQGKPKYKKFMFSELRKVES